MIEEPAIFVIRDEQCRLCPRRGFAVSAEMMPIPLPSPSSAGDGGWSESTTDGTTHETCGRLPESHPQ